MANDIYYLDFGYTISVTNQYLVPAARDDERTTGWFFSSLSLSGSAPPNKIKWLGWNGQSYGYLAIRFSIHKIGHRASTIAPSYIQVVVVADECRR